MVEAGLRGVSGFRLRTTRPDSVSMMTKLTVPGGSRSEAMICATGAGTPTPSAAHAQAGVQKNRASAARFDKFNLHALHRHTSQVRAAPSAATARANRQS